MNTAKQLPFQVFKFHPKSEARVNQAAIIVSVRWTCCIAWTTTKFDLHTRCFKSGGMSTWYDESNLLRKWPTSWIIACRGINDQIKLHAQHLANRTGALAVVPDLYKGKIGVNAEVCRVKWGSLWSIKSYNLWITGSQPSHEWTGLETSHAWAWWACGTITRSKIHVSVTIM